MPRTPIALHQRCLHRRRRLRRQVCTESLEARALLTTITMTDHDQLLLELVNRARANPTAEAARQGIGLNDGIGAGTISTDPKPPLAPNQFLINAAAAHSQDMINRNFFNHVNPDNVTAEQRIVNAGYTPFTTYGENIARVGTTGTLNQVQAVHDSHRNLFVSTTGHRQALMNPNYREVGPTIRFGPYTKSGVTYNGALTTQDFGSQSGSRFITGVVYTDSDVDQLYSVGEAVRSGTIRATNLTSGLTWAESIGVSGGYSIQVPDGNFSVTASYTLGATSYLTVVNVAVAGQNVKADFETSSAAPVTLSLSSPVGSVHETGSDQSVLVTLNRNGDLGVGVSFQLINPDTSELSLPSSVTIPAGQQSASFTVTAANDNIIDGNILTTISVSATGYVGDSLNVTTVDTTIPELPSTVTETTGPRPEFTWTSVSNAADYQLWVNNVGGSVVINQSGIAATTWTPGTDLVLGTYYAWVRGRTAGNVWSPWSPISVWRVRSRPTVQNSGVEASDDFTIGWTSVPGAADYDVWVNRITSGTSQYYRNASVSGTSVNVSDFAPGKYGIWVLARDAAGFSGFWSPMAQITVSVPVTNIQATAATLADSPLLTWNAVTGAAQYEVWINHLTTGVSPFVHNSAVEQTSLLLTTLTPGSYRAWVRARDESGGGYAWSAPMDFSAQAPSRVLTPSGGGHSATPLFSWTAVSGATRYELWVSSLAGAGRVIHETNLTSTTFTPVVPLAAGNYRIWIRAFDSTNVNTGWSVPLDFSVVALHPNDPSASGSTELTATMIDSVFAAPELGFAVLDQRAGQTASQDARFLEPAAAPDGSGNDAELTAGSAPQTDAAAPERLGFPVEFVTDPLSADRYQDEARAS